MQTKMSYNTLGDIHTYSHGVLPAMTAINKTTQLPVFTADMFK